MSAVAQVEKGAHDFDFWMGSWHVHNRRLRGRLAGSDDWEEFESKVAARPGLFEGEDTFGGQPIVVRSLWSGVTTQTPRREQAFSADGGRTWETNWIMEITPTGDGP